MKHSALIPSPLFSWILPAAMLAVLCPLLLPLNVRGADDVLDYKRKAATQLMRDGKPTEAISLIKEVIATNNGNWQDELLLARALEKTNQIEEAIPAWRKVQDLTAAASSDQDARLARIEAEKRIRILDPGAARLEAAVEEASRKLSVLEHDPDMARNPATFERLLRLLAVIDEVQGRKDHVMCDIASTALWTDSGMFLQAGRTYRIRAFGTWRCDAKKPETECNADGLSTEPADACGPIGSLSGQITTQGQVFPIGRDLVLTPRFSGMLRLACNVENRAGTSGTMRVYISRTE